MASHLISDAPVGQARRGSHFLDVFFAPSAVAVFGATEEAGSPGRALMSNLVHHPFGGMLFPVSPRRSVHGVEAYPELAAVPVPVDLALVLTPAPEVPEVLARCAAAGVKGAVVLSSGFGGGVPAGSPLERRIAGVLRDSPLRVVGPNSFGIACPRTGFNSTFAHAMVPQGKIAFLSQSNAVLTALLSQEAAVPLGCSAFVSVGSLLDVGWAEWLAYLGRDPQTRCLGIYLDRLGDARSFFTAVREVALRKPVVLIKGGRENPEAEVEDEMFEEACRCSGVLRVRKFADLFRLAAHLTSWPAARGRRLALVTNARGPGLLASDALQSAGGRLAELAPATVVRLAEVLTGQWNRQNPIDVGNGADARCFAAAVAAAAHDPNADALVVLLAPHPTMDPLQVAEGLRDLARNSDRPVLTCWMWGAARPECLAVLRDAGIPTFHSPEAAVRAFSYLWRHAENLRYLADLREVLTEAEEEAVARGRATAVLDAARRAGRTVLTEAEGRELLTAYGLPVQWRPVAAREAEAAATAEAIGYPVLLELTAGPGTVEPDEEVVRLKAASKEGVGRAVRILNLVARGQFGGGPAQLKIRPCVPPGTVDMAVQLTADRTLDPVVRLGEGCCRGGIPRHPVLAMTPLTPLTVREMIQQHPRLAARARSPEEPLDLDGLVQFLLRLSRLAAEQPWIKEITINPLQVGPNGVEARELRVVLHGGK